MNSRTLLAIHGDAIYTSNVPPWALPVAQGGAAMTARTGGLRVKGVLPGPLEAPQTGSERACSIRAGRASRTPRGGDQ